MPNDKGNDSNRNIVESVFKEWGIALFGIADLKGIATPRDKNGTEYPRAVSFVVPMNPEIMSSIRKGPNQAYADEYNRVNRTINEIARSIEARIHERGARAQMISASDRTDLFTIKGDFPHKTAATRAGLGWVGRNCLLITKQHGPWIRLGTVLTDLAVGADVPVVKNYCGKCRECVDSCPAGALAGNAWYPGIPRQEILDVFACDRWKKEHYFRYNKGHNCGICAAVCPFGK
jgi:epoxyqueuosine reductase